MTRQARTAAARSVHDMNAHGCRLAVVRERKSNGMGVSSNKTREDFGLTLLLYAGACSIQ